MSWTVDLIAPDGVTPKATRTDADPGGIVGGFSWRATRLLDCLSATMRVHAPTLGIRNRDLVRLTVNGTPVFYGPVVECPHPRDPSFGDVNLAGASELLGRTIIGSEVYENVDVALIVRDLVQKYRHPGVTYDESLIPLTGKELTKFSMPFRTLGQALDSLSKTLATTGVPFGVRPDGRLFFGVPLPAGISVPYAGVKGLALIRVDGTDVITEATLIALSRASGLTPNKTSIYPPHYLDGVITPPEMYAKTGYFTYGLPYKPGTYSLKTVAAGFETHHLQAASIVPDGADVFAYLSTDTQLFTAGFTDAANALDGTDATFAASDGSASPALQFSQAIGADADPVVGFRLRYSLDTSGFTAAQYTPGVTLQYVYPEPGGNQYGTATFDWILEDTGGAVREASSVRPLPQEFLTILRPDPWTTATPNPYKATVNCSMNTAQGAPALPAGRLKVYALEFITLSRVKVDAYAQATLRPPAQQPSEVVVAGLVGALSTVTVTGAPGGDVTGDVAEIAGELTSTGDLRATLKLEQPGASTAARVIRIAARDQAQGAQTDLRGYLERTT